MRPWIKDTIKQGRVAYLSYIEDDATRTMVFPYIYDKGHLKGTLSILQADLINQLKKYPYVSILISDDTNTISMQGRIKFLEHDLDEDWKSVKSSLDYFDLKENYPELVAIPHVWKRVIIDFIPSKLDASSNNEDLSYEMEIL